MGSASVLSTTKDLDHGAWLALRRQGIGSSDAAAIAGLNPYRSPMGVYLDKVGEMPEQEPNERMYWGTVLEDVVAKEFALRSGLKVRRRNAVLQSAIHPFMLANLDRECYGGPDGVGIVECKTTSAWNANAWDDAAVPDMYAIQVHHQLAVTGYAFGWVAVLIGGNDFRMKRIDRDPEIIAYLIRIEADFWRLVESRTPPDVDGTEASAQAIRLMYPRAQRIQAALPLELRDDIASYRLAKAEVKEWEQRADLAAQRIQAALGDAEEGLLAGQVAVTWRNVSSTRLDTKALKAEQPDIYDRYAKESLTRRFLVKEASL